MRNTDLRYRATPVTVGDSVPVRTAGVSQWRLGLGSRWCSHTAAEALYRCRHTPADYQRSRFPYPCHPKHTHTYTREFAVRNTSWLVSGDVLTLMAWYRKTPCMASLMASIPLKENERLERPPLILAPGRLSYTHTHRWLLHRLFCPKQLVSDPSHTPWWFAWLWWSWWRTCCAPPCRCRWSGCWGQRWCRWGWSRPDWSAGDKHESRSSPSDPSLSPTTDR